MGTAMADDVDFAHQRTCTVTSREKTPQNISTGKVFDGISTVHAALTYWVHKDAGIAIGIT
jgi:hypothetical protein